jgi:hypothetical protein
VQLDASEIDVWLALTNQTRVIESNNKNSNTAAAAAAPTTIATATTPNTTQNLRPKHHPFKPEKSEKPETQYRVRFTGQSFEEKILKKDLVVRTEHHVFTLRNTLPHTLHPKFQWENATPSIEGDGYGRQDIKGPDVEMRWVRSQGVILVSGIYQRQDRA